MKPTAGEYRNGWTPETLARYFAERDEQAKMRIFAPERKPPPRVENTDDFDPHNY